MAFSRSTYSLYAHSLERQNNGQSKSETQAAVFCAMQCIGFYKSQGNAVVAQQFRGAGAWAQASAKERTLIGWLSGSASKVAGLFADDFVEGMLELGYIQGRDFEMVSRYAEGIQDRLKILAEEIVGLKPNVIVAAAVNAAVPAHSATSVIPIVCPALADAVHLGLIASEARPGGNVTAIRKPRRSAKN